MKNTKRLIRNSKYSDADTVITACIKGKNINKIENIDFPAERYFVIWNKKYLNQAQREKRRAFRRSIKAKITAKNLQEIAKKDKSFRLFQKEEKKRIAADKIVILVKEKLERKVIKNRSHQEEFQPQITQQTDGSFKVKIDSKTTIQVKAGNNPYEAVTRYKNRNNISKTGKTINP